MRLDFNVLCIDDQPKNITGAIERLRLHVEDEGFRLNIKYAENLEEAAQAINDHVLADGIDLVVVDYNLGSGSGGEKALARVKRAMPFKDVVFYSSSPTDELRRHVFEAGVEGVYCANRTSLGDTLEGVFDALVKKVLDIDHCRGIILGATSDLDHLVNEMLLTVDGQLSEEERLETLQFALERIDEGLERFRTKREQLSKDLSVKALLDDTQLFTSADRLHLLLSLHDRKFHQKSPFRKTIGRYLGRVVPVRNLFAHVRLTHGEHQSRLSGFGGETLDSDTLRAVRKELIGLRDQFQQLAELVRNAGGDGEALSTEELT